MPGSRCSLLRDPRDRLPVALACAHALALCLQPPWPVVGLLMWWNSNAIAHQATHRRLFVARSADSGFAALLTLLLGVPQQLWRQRHRAHHRGRRPAVRWNLQLAGEALGLAAFVLALAILAPGFLFGRYAPGVGAGLLLCALHGRGEHLAGGTISTRGRLWNLLFLNDGYHVEHHRRPGTHWRDLPRQRTPDAAASRLPPPLRALRLPSCMALDLLERLVLRSAALRRFVLAVHRPALAQLLAAMPAPRRVVVVGGGLFPRTALLCPPACGSCRAPSRPAQPSTAIWPCCRWRCAATARAATASRPRRT
jgi:hypothetical protein